MDWFFVVDNMVILPLTHIKELWLLIAFEEIWFEILENFQVFLFNGTCGRGRWNLTYSSALIGGMMLHIHKCHLVCTFWWIFNHTFLRIFRIQLGWKVPWWRCAVQIFLSNELLRVAIIHSICEKGVGGFVVDDNLLTFFVSLDELETWKGSPIWFP